MDRKATVNQIIKRYNSGMQKSSSHNMLNFEVNGLQQETNNTVIQYMTEYIINLNICNPSPYCAHLDSYIIQCRYFYSLMMVIYTFIRYSVFYLDLYIFQNLACSQSEIVIHIAIINVFIIAKAVLKYISIIFKQSGTGETARQKNRG